jgi:hypothetical protein
MKSESAPQTADPLAWPKDEQDFNRWNKDAAALAKLIQDSPRLWLCDSALKYLVLRIDTRDGGFVLADRDGKTIEPERVVRAAASAREKFGVE